MVVKETWKHKILQRYRSKINWVKEAKMMRLLAILFGGVAAFMMALGLYDFSIAHVFRTYNWYLTLTQSNFNTVSFLSFFSGLSLVLLVPIIVVSFLAVLCYAFSLQARIKALEEKVSSMEMFTP